MNELLLLGRLTADVELKETAKSEYARFTLAVDREQSDGADFIGCVAFGNTAKALAANCSKGRQLLVKGRLQVTQNNGKSYYSVVSNRITFLQKPKEAPSTEPAF